MASRASELRDRSRLRTRRSMSKGPDPQPTSASKPAPTDAAREKTLLDKWVEPDLRSASSYHDHGGLPYGVLEHMQPLGEAPNAKVKARVKVDGARKSALGRTSAVVGWDVQETPEGTPGPPTLSQLTVNGQGGGRTPLDESKDESYSSAVVLDAGRPTRTRAATRRTQENLEQADATPPTRHKPVYEEAPTAPHRIYSDRKLDQIVQSAKWHATHSWLPHDHVAVALDEFWDAARKNQRLVQLLEAHLQTSITDQERVEFNEHFRLAKRRARRKERRARKQHEKGSENVTIKTPSAPRLLSLKAPAKPPSHAAEPSSSATRGRAKAAERSDGTSRAPNTTIHSVSALPTTEADARPRPRLSLKVKSPNAISITATTHDQPHRPNQRGAKSLSTPKKNRTDSVGSDSSLTSLTSPGDDAMDVDSEQPATRSVGKSRNPANAPERKGNSNTRGDLAPETRQLKRTTADADLAEDEQQRTLTAKKRRLQDRVVREVPSQESSIRRSLRDSATRAHGGKVGLSITVAPRAFSTTRQTPAKETTQGIPADADSPLSSEASGLSASLGGPPSWLPIVPPYPGKRAKTKTSPEKKTNTAGRTLLPGVGGGGRGSPIGEDEHEDELSENNDFCSACGGSGYLLCCDGCDRSFHFSCLDPPLSEDASELNEPWFCFICVAKRPRQDQTEKILHGIFAPLFTSLRKRNPTNFALPADIREYFEGVAVDKDGNFLEAISTRTRNRGGYEEAPDFYRVKDNKGNTIFCHACCKTATGKRSIITCDFCSEHWHLDCLDPPLANPPALNQNGRKVHDWMCPLHADHELRRVDTLMLGSDLRRRVHVRRPRNARVVETAMSRGFCNNGVIDILQDESDDSESEFYDDEAPDESVIYRMPASGIKLDFIDKVKSTRIQRLRDVRISKRLREDVQPPSALKQANFARRSILEQQLALNLAQFANSNHDLNLGKDQLQNLLGTLIAEAPTEVIDTMMRMEDEERAISSASAIPPSPPSSDQPDTLSSRQRQELQMLQELIRRKLECSKI